MPYKHPIPDSPIAPSMLPRVPAAKLTLQDILVLTQPGNNPGQKNKGLELGTLFEAVKSSLPKDTLLVDEQDENPSHYLTGKFKGNSSASYLDEGDVGFHVVSIRGERFIVGVIENQAVTTDKLADNAVTSPKIATGGVSNGNLADNSVSKSKIADGSVTSEKIAAVAVTSEKIAPVGAPIILVKLWKEGGAQLTCKRANPGDLASWRMKNMNFDNMGRMSMVSDDYTYMPVPNNFGTTGQLLISNGDGNAPKWKSVIVLPPIQKGFAYSGSGNSNKYAYLCHICKSSQSGASDTIHATFKIYTNTTGNGLSATADVWYRRNNDKQGTTKGQLTWTHEISPSEFKLYANVYDDLSNNININIYAYMGATYQRVEVSLDNISSLNSPSTITNTNTSLLTDFISNSFSTSLPTLGQNLELT